jgi:hypothetical protein
LYECIVECGQISPSMTCARMSTGDKRSGEASLLTMICK